MIGRKRNKKLTEAEMAEIHLVEIKHVLGTGEQGNAIVFSGLPAGSIVERWYRGFIDFEGLISNVYEIKFEEKG